MRNTIIKAPLNTRKFLHETEWHVRQLSGKQYYTALVITAVRSRKERSTSNPQKYQFSHCTSHSPILPAYEALSHRNIRKPSSTPINPDHWLGLPQQHRGADEDLGPCNPLNLQKSKQLAWVSFWWRHSWNMWEKCSRRSSSRKHSKMTITSKDLLQFSWFSIVFSNSLGSLNFLYLENELISL